MSQNPTPATPAPPTVKVTGIERTGTGLTVVGVVAAAIPLLYLAFASNIKLDTLSSIQSLLSTGLILAVVAAVVGLVATGLNVPNLGKRLGPGLSTVFSGATLITMALFLFVTVLPRVSALSTLNDKTVPFAKSLNTNCKKPLNAVGADYQKTQLDANGLAGIFLATQGGGPAPTATDIGGFVQLMTADTQLFQADVTKFTTAQTNLNKLTSPDKKYDKLLADCKRDVASTLDALNGNPGAITTADYLKTINALLAAQTKDATVLALLGQIVQSNFPQAYNAVTLLQASTQIEQGKETIQLPAGLTPAQQQAFATSLGQIFAGTFPGYVSAAMGTLSTTTDIPLNTEGDQLVQDIKDTLTTNLAPFTVDTDKIVDDASK